MLKTGKVYIHNNEYLLVFGHRTYNRRRIYTVQKVSPNGKVSVKTKEVKYQRGQFQLTDIKVIITTQSKKTDRETMLFYQSLKMTLEDLKVFATSTKTHQEKMDIATSLFSTIGMFDSKISKRADIRHIAKLLGFKKPTKMYKMIAYSFSDYATEKSIKEMEKSADSTLAKIYSNFNELWPFMHGFNKELDTALEVRLNAIVKLMRERGI